MGFGWKILCYLLLYRRALRGHQLRFPLYEWIVSVEIKPGWRSILGGNIRYHILFRPVFHLKMFSSPHSAYWFGLGSQYQTRFVVPVSKLNIIISLKSTEASEYKAAHP